ncbi:MAG TPA: hypothetical protein VN597_14030 [Streptosporangiaceae bacterium]|nr:hypothetical protein [Streptosporangiaceae bacterium]
MRGLASNEERTQLVVAAFDAYRDGDHARGDRIMAVLRVQLPWWERRALRLALVWTAVKILAEGRREGTVPRAERSAAAVEAMGGLTRGLAWWERPVLWLAEGWYGGRAR